MANSVHDRPIEAARNLISELDQLAARRPNGNPVLPPVLCFKPHNQKNSAAHAIPNQYWASSNVKKPALPHVLSILDRPDLDDLALFGYMYDNLIIPRPMGRFYFTNLKMALDLLGQTPDPGATSLEAKRTDVVNKLYRKRRSKLGGRTSNVISTHDGHDGLLGFIAVILEISRRIRFRLFRTKLITTARYSWFTDRVALALTEKDQADEVPQDFLSCAVWTLQQPQLHNSALARELLMLALFEDLERAFKSRPGNLSLHQRRRTTPFIITFRDVNATDSAVRRFLQTFGELMDQSKGAALLILASVNGQPPPALLADKDTFHTAAEKLQLIRHGHYESSAITAFNIQATANAKQVKEIRQLITNRVAPKPRPLLSDFTLLTIIGVVLAPFVIASIIYAVRVAPLLYQSTQSCKYVRAETSEVVGITDGSCSFLTKNDARHIGYAETENAFWRQVKIRWDGVKDLYIYIRSLGNTTPHAPNAQRLTYIHELNSAKQVILSQNRLIRDNDVYRTIVLLLPLTAPDEAGHTNQKTIGILRGVAVAQEEINRNADRAPNGSLQHLKLKILIANTGDRLTYGQSVARDIRVLNQHGLTRLTPRHSIVAVAGITQSIAEAKRTVNVLTSPDSSGNPAITVIGSTLTYDHMSDGNPLFFQAAAPNKRQAQVLAEFIRHQPLVGDVSANMPHLLKPARNIFIISGNNDWYSQNLADNLYHEFTTSLQTNGVLGHWSMPGGKDEDADPHLKHQAEVIPLSTIQARLCDPASLPGFDQQQDVIVYTGRSQNFSTFLSALKPDVCARGKGFTIVAGSDIAQWGDYETYKHFFPHLYFAAYGSRDSDHNGAIADSFFANPTVKGIVDQSGAARAYDSIRLIWTVVQGSKLPVERINTGAIANAFLDGPHLRFEGASGVLDIPPGQQVPISKPVFVMRAGSRQPVMSCGLFSIQPPGSPERLNAHGQPFAEFKWGSERQFDCPNIVSSSSDSNNSR